MHCSSHILFYKRRINTCLLLFSSQHSRSNLKKLVVKGQKIGKYIIEKQKTLFLILEKENIYLYVMVEMFCLPTGNQNRELDTKKQKPSSRQFWSVDT